MVKSAVCQISGLWIQKCIITTVNVKRNYWSDKKYSNGQLTEIAPVLPYPKSATLQIFHRHWRLCCQIQHQWCDYCLVELQQQMQQCYIKGQLTRKFKLSPLPIHSKLLHSKLLAHNVCIWCKLPQINQSIINQSIKQAIKTHDGLASLGVPRQMPLLWRSPSTPKL